MEVAGAAAVPSGVAQSPAFDPGALDSPSQIDKTNSFMSRWLGPIAKTPLNPEVARHNLDQLARGFSSTVTGVLKAPGQAMEAVENFREAHHYLEPQWFKDLGDKPGKLFALQIGASKLIDQFQKEFIDDPRKEIPFEDQLSQGAGSALAFMGTGALLTTAGVSPYLASAAAGGAVGASQQYDDAVAHGATPEQAAIAYLGGSAFGATEAIPGAIFLNKLNKITGGKMLETLKNFNQSQESSTALEAIKGGLEEAVQEGIQSLGQNWVAADLAAYDPSRPLGENFWQNVATASICCETLKRIGCSMSLKPKETSSKMIQSTSLAERLHQSKTISTSMHCEIR
jgi:hypothetical protein